MKKVFCFYFWFSLLFSGILVPVFAQQSQEDYPFRNPELSIEERVNNLV